MTIIVGVRYKGNVWIGADTKVTDTATRHVGRMKKVRTYRCSGDQWLIGVSGDSYLCARLLMKFDPPALKRKTDLLRMVSLDLADHIRDIAKECECFKKDDRLVIGVGVLVAVRGRLFQITNTLHVVEHPDYCAIGVASEAMGSLFSTTGKKPKARILTALSAAAYRNPDCVSKPFNIRSI